MPRAPPRLEPHASNCMMPYVCTRAGQSARVPQGIKAPSWRGRSPFQLPTRLADGLGLESDRLGNTCRALPLVKNLSTLGPPPLASYETKVRLRNSGSL